MTDSIQPGEDPAEVEPTDNSTGDLVDVELVEEVEGEGREDG